MQQITVYSEKATEKQRDLEKLRKGKGLYRDPA